MWSFAGMILVGAVVFVCLLTTTSSAGNLPLVINTWTFLNATRAGGHHVTIILELIYTCSLGIAVGKLHEGGTYLDAIVAGGTECEVAQCDHTVGYGGR